MNIARDLHRIVVRPLPRDEERRLIEAAQQGDCTARNRLVEQSLVNIRKLAQQFASRRIDAGDLYSAGAIALLKCIEDFDLERGDPVPRLWTYARGPVLAAMRRERIKILSLVRVPRDWIGAGKKPANFVAQVAASSVRPTSLSYEKMCSSALAEEFDYDLTEDWNLPVINLVDEANRRERVQRAALLQEAMNQLSQESRRLLWQRFCGGLSLRKIARLNGVGSPNTIRNRLCLARSELRAALNNSPGQRALVPA